MAPPPALGRAGGFVLTVELADVNADAEVGEAAGGAAGGGGLSASLFLSGGGDAGNEPSALWRALAHAAAAAAGRPRSHDGTPPSLTTRALTSAVKALRGALSSRWLSTCTSPGHSVPSPKSSQSTCWRTRTEWRTYENHFVFIGTSPRTPFSLCDTTHTPLIFFLSTMPLLSPFLSPLTIGPCILDTPDTLAMTHLRSLSALE